MSDSIYIVAGELSGDMHGAELMRAVSEMRPDIQFLGYGGDNMCKVGGTHDWLEKSAVMGIVEVLKQYKWFKQKLQEMADEIIEKQPTALVLLDYPKFNLMLAERVRAADIKTKIVYYISPKVWAWNKKRVPKMAKLLDKMICIFPFEVEIYEKVGLPVEYVGNPLVDELGIRGSDDDRDRNLVGMFPGSREREIAKLFPIMVHAAVRLHSKYPNLRFEVPAASAKLAQQMKTTMAKMQLPKEDLVTISEGGSHSLMRRAYCGVVASGTATLEAAWLGLPYCLVYKVALPTYVIAKAVVKIKYIGLVNILAGRAVVEEFIQGDADPCHLEQAIEAFINDEAHRETIQNQLIETAETMGEPGVHKRAAQALLKAIE